MQHQATLSLRYLTRGAKRGARRMLGYGYGAEGLRVWNLRREKIIREHMAMDAAYQAAHRPGPDELRRYTEGTDDRPFPFHETRTTPPPPIEDVLCTSPTVLTAERFPPECEPPTFPYSSEQILIDSTLDRYELPGWSVPR